MKNKIIVCSVAIVIVVSLFAGCGSLTRSATRGDLEGVKSWVENGADINVVDRWGWTPIMWATYYNYYDIVKYMVEHKANVNARSMYDYGSILKDSTPLVIAVTYNYNGIVRLLLRHGADKKAENRQGETAFTIAEKHNMVEMLELLGGKAAVKPDKKEDEKAGAEEASQVILLNDGSQIVGKILSQTRTTVTVKTKYNTITIEKDKISEMKYK
ncbi:MAG: ankyrin repeat domain-containing protein [Spirochaetes bacterium]|nr:ankyrin repeat domain-containing protein [Spirochaetota bacterium]